MFHKPQLDKKETTIDSLIGKKIHMHGDVIFEGGLRLDGQITGNLKTKDQQTGTLIISEQARVLGEVHVTHLVMNGYIEGNVHISSLLELQPQARIKGDVHYVMLEMHQGAIVEGRLIHTPSLERPAQQNNFNHSNNLNHQNTDVQPNLLEDNIAPVGFNLHAAGVAANTGLVANQMVPNSLFTEVEDDARMQNQSEQINQEQKNEHSSTHPLEQLQNKIVEGLSFFKGK